MFNHLLDQVSQLYPPEPSFTESSLPVYIVTGASAGVGKELARMLYSKNARVYVAARSEEKALAAIADIESSQPSSAGALVFLPLDLADLATIAASARRFLDREPRLHVLFNNAGVMRPPKNSLTKQGYELQLGVNNLGAFLFTRLLSPRLVDTAKSEAPGTVRVVWVASSAAEAPQVPRGGVRLDDMADRPRKGPFASYALSKAGNYLHAVEMARRYRDRGVLSIPLNPGNLDSELWRTQTPLVSSLLRTFVLHPPRYGALTELFAGLSDAVTPDRSGAWVGPWGRFLTIRKDLQNAVDDGTSKAFWDWTEEQVKQYETPAN
ncbi:short-chain dehydrogenase [Metarhizium album ARSEF 1941]|uniref:Short-chain dehydrogenase n=1 Tax=Metarhizium album (strain ARSEF 1941) TaxID=1081103 RepID=A0A0B2WXX1_METAS|nr:short-chain dehydrogenase [Metarhizium album ARSEF 1941]KHN98893.1 short-chain dehydrogenase [Metarhizium album ARSEF 1941]